MADAAVRSSDPPPSADRRAVTWWWIAAVFVTGILLAALAVVFLGQDRPGSSPVTTVPTSVPTGGGPRGCDVSQGPQDIPAGPPAGIDWRTTNFKTVLPFSASSGPLVDSPPLARCYSRDPVGALIAASQIYARFLNPNRDEAAQVIREQFVDGPRKQQLLESLLTPGSPPDQIQWRGFKYLSYNKDQAVVVLAFESPGRTVTGGLPITVKWVDGDWRYDFESFVNPYEISEAEVAGYAAWSGVR